MKKLTLIASLSLLLCGATATAAETNFEWDFSKGFEGFTIYDQDGRKPQSAAQQLGFDAAGDSWIQLYYYKDPVAASNSTHSPIGKSEDWLITPAITVGDNNIFSFDAVTVAYGGADKVAEFEVKISTTGTAVEDFTDLATKETATSQWSSLAYDLSEYAGRTVYLAIVNVGRQKDVLIVDNLFVGIPALAKIEPVYTRIQEKTTNGQRIQVNLTAGLAEAITSIEATLTCGDFTTTRNIDNANITPGAKYSFQFNESLPAPTPGEAQVFDIDVIVNGVETITASGEIITQAYQPAKRVVCEEQTGTWCGWCPRGHVYMEKMDEDYPDTYIGIASHVNDVMQNYDYASYTSANLGGGAPLGRVQRTSAPCDPSEFPSLYKTYIKTPALADISIYAYWKDETQKTFVLNTSTTFALSASNLDTRLEYIIVEDDVNQPGDSRYDQANYYAGGSAGAMGGYENSPSTIVAANMYYDDVVRHTITDEVGEGIAGSVPSAIKKGETYTHSIESSIPQSVINIDNCEFIVLLIDYQTGNVLNAAKCNTINTASVESIENNDTRVIATDNGIRVEVNTNAQVVVNVYATDGRLVHTATPRQVNGQTSIDCPVNGHGVYLVNVVCDGIAKTHKVIL